MVLARMRTPLPSKWLTTRNIPGEHKVGPQSLSLVKWPLSASEPVLEIQAYLNDAVRGESSWIRRFVRTLSEGRSFPAFEAAGSSANLSEILPERGAGATVCTALAKLANLLKR